jgi:hypothetical protein
MESAYVSLYKSKLACTLSILGCARWIDLNTRICPIYRWAAKFGKSNLNVKYLISKHLLCIEKMRLTFFWTLMNSSKFHLTRCFSEFILLILHLPKHLPRISNLILSVYTTISTTLLSAACWSNRQSRSLSAGWKERFLSIWQSRQRSRCIENWKQYVKVEIPAPHPKMRPKQYLSKRICISLLPTFFIQFVAIVSWWRNITEKRNIKTDKFTWRASAHMPFRQSNSK